MVENNDDNRANLAFCRVSQMDKRQKDKVLEAYFIQQYEDSDILFQDDWKYYIRNEECV